MKTAEYRKTLLLHTAQALATSHGVFYAAAFLADSGIPIQDALKALVSCRSSIIIPPPPPATAEAG